jgi:chemotaxis protein MotB
MQGRAVNCENELNSSKNQINLLEVGLANEKNRSKSLEQQMEYFKSTNTDLLARLSDLSVVSKSGAESIKKSLEALNEQNKYIKDLTSSIQRKDSINLVLVMNLKRSLDNFEDEDINIEVKKGVVYVSISDKMLFRSGSYNISNRAEEVIGKIAKIINDHKELDILVEGHTDNVPISTDCITDNWDLSVKRATSIVRLMQTKFAVLPIRMTAGGRSEYLPKAANTIAEGRAINRRTEIIILPKLDQFFELLEPPTSMVEGQSKG